MIDPIPTAGHDEIRLATFAQILGFELADTGFYRHWLDPAVERVFTADPREVAPSEVERELMLPSGRRVFHPCRGSFDAVTIEHLTSVVK